MNKILINLSSELIQSRQGRQILVREMERKPLRLPGEGKQTGNEIDEGNLSRCGDGTCSMCLTFELVEAGLDGGALRLRRKGSRFPAISKSA